MVNAGIAPGWPGIPARWTSSAKCGIGTANSSSSTVWFTISHGILNEIYYPRMDQAMIRDMEFIVTDGANFFSEEKRDTEHSVERIESVVPAYFISNKCLTNHFKIEKRIITDPGRPVVLQKIKFISIKKVDYRVHVLLAPHIANHGAGNNAWIGNFNGHTALIAARGGFSSALLSSAPITGASAGFVGYSDGWRDLKTNKKLTEFYERAENGNVALVAEIDMSSPNAEAVLALGFGVTPEEASEHALESILIGFEDSQERYLKFWTEWNRDLWTSKSRVSLFDISKVVLKAHTDIIRGGIIASLSVPWGFAKGDDDLGGYHLVWPRDMAEAAGAFVAIVAKDEVHEALSFLETTQEDDGHWPQNMWLDGKTYWSGIQMDESALPGTFGRPRISEGHHLRTRCQRVLANDEASGGIHCSERTRESGGSMGRRSGLYTVYTLSGDRFTCGRSRIRGEIREPGDGQLSARDGRHMEFEYRKVDLRFGHSACERDRSGRVLRSYFSDRCCRRRFTQRRICPDQE